MRYIMFFFSAVLSLVLITGCSDDDDGPTAPSSTSSGTLHVLLTDAPGAFDEVNITFAEVSVNSESGWLIVNEEEQTHNLLDLANGVTAALGETTLDPGVYNQVRLLITNAELVIGEESYLLDVPSGESSGLKLHGEFTIEENVITELIIDFDVAKSIHEVGNKGEYKLNPSLRLVSRVTTGFIGGTVTNYQDAPVAYAIAEEDTVTSAIINEQDGTFLLSFLPEGVYSVAVVDTLDQRFDISGISVSVEEITNIDEITLE